MIVNELQTNPILEEISPAEMPEKPESVGENPDDFDGEDLQPSQNNQSDEQLKRDFVLNSIPDTQSLREYLLNESKLDAENARVAEAFEALDCLRTRRKAALWGRLNDKARHDRNPSVCAATA